MNIAKKDRPKKIHIRNKKQRQLISFALLITLLLPLALYGRSLPVISTGLRGLMFFLQQSGSINAHINFQPDASPVPSGYTKDIGEAYDATRGFGWVRQDSLGATHVPLSIVPNSRDRDLNSDQRLDTLLHMQYPNNNSATAVKIPAAWEYALPNGTYTVKVAVGDATTGADAENYVINVEGTLAINHYIPSGAKGSSTRHTRRPSRCR